MDDNFILLDSDVLLKKDISDLFIDDCVYVGEIENNSLTLPNSVDGEKYRINNFFFVEGSEMLYNIGAGTRSFVIFNGFTHLHEVKTVYVPAGIEYQDSVFPNTVSVVTV